MNLVLSGPIDASLLNLAVARTQPRDVIRLHDRAQRLVGAVDDSSARADIERLCSLARVDHAFVEEGLRFSDFKLLAMDMDSTLITIECIDEIADFAGKKAEVAAITAAAMRGEIPDFAESLRRRVALLAGVDSSKLRSVYDERLRLTDGAQLLITKCHSSSVYTLLLSGGFTYFTKRLQKDLQLHAAFANTLIVQNRKLTGNVKEPILDATGKARKVADTMQHLNCAPSEAVVIGDGSNDIPMMQQVKHSIAYHASPTVLRSARYNINYGTLETVLDYLSNARPQPKI